jgi:mRNA interferase MazF
VEPFATGVVILVRFPFSDLSQTKLRPAVILADSGRWDSILCQVTSKPYGDERAIKLDDASFCEGSLRATSTRDLASFSPPVAH